MGIKEVIKKSVLEGFGPSSVSTATVIVTLAAAGLLGLYIYFIYRLSSRRGFYNRNFNKALAAMPPITAGIMLAMQANLLISLGMVGALSIVRFRNAVKDSMDLTFMFWSISAGIIAGTQLFELAVLLCLGITVLVFLLDMLPALRGSYMLVISCAADADDDAIKAAVKKFCPRARVRSHNISQRGGEWIFELQLRDEKELVKEVSMISGVKSANLISHDGDIRF